MQAAAQTAGVVQIGKPSFLRDLIGFAKADEEDIIRKLVGIVRSMTCRV